MIFRDYCNSTVTTVYWIGVWHLEVQILARNWIVFGTALRLTQERMAELFGVESHTINYHLKEIYKTAELEETATDRKIRVVQKERNRGVGRDLDLYNLDAIIAVWYRVNHCQDKQVRIKKPQAVQLPNFIEYAKIFPGH